MGREQWPLVVLFAVTLVSGLLTALAAWGVLVQGVWALTAALVAAVTLGALLVWWAVQGFSGYEHLAGIRIIRRLKPGGGGWAPIVVSAALAVVGTLLLWLGVRSAAIAVVVALAALATMVMLLARRYAVFATLSIVGIAIGVAALIVVQSVATGFQHEFERRVLGVYAHINVTRAFGISEYRRFETYLRTVPGVAGASPFVYYAMALAPVGDVSGVHRASVLVKGIEPSTAGEVIDLADHLKQENMVPISDLRTDIELQPVADRDDARLPEVIAQTPDPRGPGWFAEEMERWRSLPDRQKYGRRQVVESDDEWPEPVEVDGAESEDPASLPTMFVGVTLARELSLKVDDVVMLVDPGATFDHTQAPDFRRYRVAGIFRAGFQEYDSRLVYVHIRELQHFKYQGRDKVSGVDLRVKNPYNAPAIEAVLRETIGDQEYSILEWQKLNANLFQSIRTQKSILTIILSLVGTVAGFNVLAALWTMVVRRTAEIAITMSMGATESGVARIFQFSGMALGSVGCVAGVAFGFVLSGLVGLYGYTLDPEVYFIERLPVEYSFVQIGAVVALMMGISFVATLPPSLRAAKLRPVEGLRYE